MTFFPESQPAGLKCFNKGAKKDDTHIAHHLLIRYQTLPEAEFIIQPLVLPQLVPQPLP